MGLLTLPNEIKLDITKYLPNLSKHLLAESLWWKLTPEKKHSRVSASIFKDDTWLSYIESKGCNPVLIGHDLYEIYHKRNNHPKYMVLVIGHAGDGGPDYGGGGRGNYRSSPETKKLFRSSLQENVSAHQSNSHGIDYDQYHEIFFENTGVILGICDAIRDDPIYRASNPSRLVCLKRNKPTSAYLYWKDESYAIKKIESKHIQGEGPRKDLSRLCNLKWEHVPGNRLRKHCFMLNGGNGKQVCNENGGFKWWEWISFRLTQ